MAHRQLTPQALQEIRDLAAGWGKIVARRAFGDEGPGQEVDLAAMEQLAQAAAGLITGTLSTLLQQHAQTLGEQQPCPDCGQPCPVHRHERPLAVQGATLQQSEPRCHCPSCRRDFFPPTPAPAP